MRDKKKPNFFKKLRLLKEQNRGTKPKEKVDEKIIYKNSAGETITEIKNNTNENE